MYLITYRTGTISSVGGSVSSYCQLTYKYIKNYSNQAKGFNKTNRTIQGEPYLINIYSGISAYTIIKIKFGISLE